MEWIALINFLSRWVLFGAVAYKAYQTKNQGWVLLSAAFLIGALDIEAYILNPLGIKIPDEVYDVASLVPSFLIGVSVVWGSLCLKNGKIKFKHALIVSILLVASYLWLFAVAANILGNNFVLENSFPSFVLGGSLLLLSYILWKRIIGERFWDRLFPIGLSIVGLLNLTYPFGRQVDWYSTFAFSAAALGRIVAAVGAFAFVFYPVVKPKKTSVSNVPPLGAYLFSSEEELLSKYPHFFRNDMIVVTRTDPERAAEKFSEGSLVFWLTRTKEGLILEKPRVIAISPSKLGILQDLITRELENGYRIVYIDALEYLKSEVGFEPTMKFLFAVKDTVTTKESVLAVVVNKNVFDERERRILEREFSL
ncbi:DUF835 domain-containing protein [Thermococcus gorgonarius]|uniref:DUF835 domain-containing protein n=1 Tax=Thermococcus gorgonarius TaxID=71997 RepID=A0A2Z2M5Y8_THEGO|nr:DUF835 domain-containing protein [Thermococcus gorgonarius]ASJ00603.1 hypothetical protein A3K92_03490 [Thermococcus gorgonarius]